MPTSVTEVGTDINKGLLQPLADAVQGIPTLIAATDAAILSNTNKWFKGSVTTASYVYDSPTSRWKYTMSLPEYKGRRIFFFDVNLNYNDSGNITLTFERGICISSDTTSAGAKLKFNGSNVLTSIGYVNDGVLFGGATSYGAVMQNNNTLLWSTDINPRPTSGNHGAYTGDVYVLNI